MSNAIKYALIYVIAAFAWSCVEYLTGLQPTRIALHPYFVTPFYLLLTGVIYYLAVKEKRASDGGKIGFGKIVVFGMTLTGLILVLNLVHFYVFNKLINPDFFPAMARHAVETTNIAGRRREILQLQQPPGPRIDIPRGDGHRRDSDHSVYNEAESETQVKMTKQEIIAGGHRAG